MRLVRALISFLLIMVLHIAGAVGDMSRHRVSWNDPEEQATFKKVLDESGIPYETIQEYGREFVVWPKNYSDKVDIIIRHGFGVDPDSKAQMLFELGRPKDAIALLTKLADNGDTEAQVALGLHYVLGRFVEKDYSKARHLYTAAIDRGSRVALVNLGVLYENGWSVTKDEVKAFELYQRAADNYQIVAAMCKVGQFYEDGKAGLTKDVIKANEWYAQAKRRSGVNLDCRKLR